MTDSIRDLESQQSALSDRLDGADLFTVILIICEETDDQPSTFIDSKMGKEIIWATQSNPNEAIDTLREMIAINNRIEWGDHPPD